MPHKVTHQTIELFWEALQRGPATVPSRREAEIKRLLSDAVADGWIGHLEIESYLICLNQGPHHLRTVDLLAVYGIKARTTFPRPRSKQTNAWGIDRVEVFDFAEFLIWMERTGFAVDPGPLCEMLRPSLLKRRYLSSPQLAVLWHKRERHRMVPVILSTTERLAFGKSSQSVKTSTGYGVDIQRDADGAAISLSVTAIDPAREPTSPHEPPPPRSLRNRHVERHPVPAEAIEVHHRPDRHLLRPDHREP